MMKPYFVFFGDSICYGQYCSPQDTWVFKISTLLSDQFIIQNNSISGDTTLNALFRIKLTLQDYNAKIVYIQFGLNDCNYWDTDKGLPRVSPLSFEANMKEIIQRAYHFGAETVIVGTNHISNKNEKYDKNNKYYNEIIRNNIVSDNVILFDIERKLPKLKDVNYLMNDGVHLNKTGHELYYVNFKQLLQKIGIINEPKY
jgi:lysophospholipase L1-like esterase